MIVSIEFLGMQRTITKTNSIDMPINEETVVQDALEYVRREYPSLRLDDGMVLITVNHEVAAIDKGLRENDTVSFVPLIGGG